MGIGSILVGCYEGRALRFAGKVGTGRGWNDEFGQKLPRCGAWRRPRSCPNAAADSVWYHASNGALLPTVDVLYLNIADSANAGASRALAFKSTPHFLFLRAHSSLVNTLQGVVPADSVRASLARLLPSRAACVEKGG